MAVIAPRMLLRERGKSMRSEAVTGSFTGALACGAAMVEEAGGGVVCACKHVKRRQVKIKVENIRFIRNLLIFSR
jgi:hypothetical protein